MRIAHVANWYGPKSGGLRTTVDALANAYVSKGHSVLVVVPGRKGELISDGLKNYLYVRGYQVPFTGGYRVILNRRAVIRGLAAFKPTVLELSDRTTLLNLSIWARRNGVHSNFFAHENVQGLLKTFFPWMPGTLALARYWNGRTMHKVDAITATTNFAGEEFRNLPDFVPSKLKLVPLGVDHSEFAPHLTDRDGSGESASQYIFACTRLSREKDPHFLIEIAREMKRNTVNYQMLIAGDGPLKAQLEAIIESENLPVKLLGYIKDRRKLSNLMGGAQTFLAVGPIETFGLAAVEALASGAPVLCRESSAVTEIIDGSCGRALPREASQWLSAIEEFNALSRDLLARRCTNRAKDFTWESCSNSLLDNYKELA